MQKELVKFTYQLQEKTVTRISIKVEEEKKRLEGARKWKIVHTRSDSSLQLFHTQIFVLKSTLQTCVQLELIRKWRRYPE